VFIILDQILLLEDSCVYSGVPAEAVTTSTLHCSSFHSWCCLVNRKVNSFRAHCTHLTKYLPLTRCKKRWPSVKVNYTLTELHRPDNQMVNVIST